MIGPLVVALIAVALTIGVALCGVGVIRRNPVVGIRIPSFFASDQAWKFGHRVAAVPMAIAACACIGLIFVANAAPASDAVLVIGSVLVMLVGVIVGAVLGARTLRHNHQ